MKSHEPFQSYLLTGQADSVKKALNIFKAERTVTLGLAFMNLTLRECRSLIRPQN